MSETMPSIAVSRRIRFAARAGTWRHLARRAAWRLEPEQPRDSVPPSWPVSPEAKQTLRIRWPRRYGWANAAGWIDPIRRGIESHVALEPADLAQPIGNVVVAEAVSGGRTRRVVIDYDDQLTLNDVVDDADIYFKMQYLRGGYGTDRVRPGGYITKQPALYRYAARLRSMRERTVPAYDVFGRFGLSWAQEIRGNALTQLREQDRFEFTGGGAPLWWGEYIDEVCAARVCLDLPGNGEFCYRLVEYLAVGACVIGPELKTEMPVPLESGVHLLRVPRKLDGLVEECETLLQDAQRRTALQRAAAEYFERYLALGQLGAYYVDGIWRALNA